MSTNYYWRFNLCDCCGRYDEKHVGKSGSSLQGHFGSDGNPLITSWQEWKRRLRSGGQIWNEYGEREDVEPYIARTERVAAEDRRRQYDWVSNPLNWFTSDAGKYLDRVEPGCDWLDADGFSFHGGDFS